MGMKCPKCGTDNLLTAVFCRGCHEKLDLNEMKPDTLVKDAKKRAALGKAPLWARITSAVIGGLIVLILIGMVLPVSQLTNKDVSGELKDKFRSLRKDSGEVVLSDAEVTAILNAETEIANSAAIGNAKFSNLSVHLRPGNAATVVMQAKLYDAVPVCYVAKVTYTTEAGLEFTPAGARIGYVPMMFGLQNLVYDGFQRILGGKKRLELVRGRIKEATSTTGSVTLKY